MKALVIEDTVTSAALVCHLLGKMGFDARGIAVGGDDYAAKPVSGAVDSPRITPRFSAVAPFIAVGVGVATPRLARSDESGFGRLPKLVDDAPCQAGRNGRNRSVPAVRAELARSA